MLDQDQVDQLRARLVDRFTAAELCEVLNLDTSDLIDMFLDEVLETDWGEIL